MTAAQVLEQIERTRVAQWRAEATLAKLVDQAVGLGIGWPEIAARLSPITGNSPELITEIPQL